MVYKAVFECAYMAAVNHLRFISSVTTGKPYQQISDLVITAHNWSQKKGHDTLSLYFLLLTPCPALCCMLYRKTLLAQSLPPSPDLPLLLSRSISPEITTTLSFLYLLSEASGKRTFSTFLHHIQSS